MTEETKKAKIILDIPQELREKLFRTSERMMVSRPSLIRLALNKFCDEVLKNA